MSSILGSLFSSKSQHKRHKRQTKKQKAKDDKYHKLKLEHSKIKSNKCCKRCAGRYMGPNSEYMKCAHHVYPTCKKSGCPKITKKDIEEQRKKHKENLMWLKTKEGKEQSLKQAEQREKNKARTQAILSKKSSFFG